MADTQEPNSEDAALRALAEVMKNPPPLHPDLVDCVEEAEGLGWKILRHPYAIIPYFGPALYAMANALYAQKTAQIEAALREDDWERYIHLHERPYRFQALGDAFDSNLVELDPAEFWELVASVWTGNENIHQELSGWREMWAMSAPGRLDHVMEEGERAALAALPEEITVYRGVGHRDAVAGLSWTTDRKTAEWFARRFAALAGRTPILATGRLAKTDVLAHFLRRNEGEIVALPENVRNQQITRIKLRGA